MKNQTIKLLGIIILSTAAGFVLAKMHKKHSYADCTYPADSKNELTSAEHIVGTVLVRSRYSLENAKSPVQMALGHEHEGKSCKEPVVTLKFVDADGAMIGIPFPKHELSENMDNMPQIATYLSNIFEKEIVYV